jgi:hypothetical protein
MVIVITKEEPTVNGKDADVEELLVLHGRCLEMISWLMLQIVEKTKIHDNTDSGNSASALSPSS